jgi:uncharacterized protein (DUF433 family)
MTIAIELTPEEEARLREEAERQGTNVSALAHSLIALTLPLEETAIVRDTQGRACLAGTRMRVSMLVALREAQGDTPERLAEEFPSLSLAQIYAALAYYYAHRAEIDAERHEEHRFLEEWLQTHSQPTREELKNLLQERRAS